MKLTLKLLPVFIFLAFLLTINITSAEQAKNLEIEIEIIGSKALISYSIETDLNQLTIILPENAKIIGSSLNYTLKDNELTANIENKTFSLDYSTDKLIENNKYFTANLQIPETQNLDIRLILPESATLEKSYPEAALTSDGRHIILNWQAKNAKSFPVFVTYNEKSEQWILWLAAIIMLIIAILAVYFLIKRNPKLKIKSKKKIKIPKENLHLLESESSVINALKQAKGEMWQKQIQLKTGFSKAKLSRVIRNLEARKLIKRIPLGNTNKIKLK